MTLEEIYKAKVEAGELSFDAAQAAVLVEFERIRAALAVPQKRGFFRKKPEPPKGLYLWGGVGRGKSMIMDMFVDALDVPAKRVHFHGFMQDIQTALHEARKRGEEDAIKPIAKQVAADARVLAFDEMQIKDITDAMIVGRLFQLLFEDGVVVVTTSNRIPDDLYKDGLNRQLFLPFIDLIKDRLVVHEMVSPTDYRQDRLSGAQVYFHPLGEAASNEVAVIWQGLSQGNSTSFDVTVKGRTLRLPQFHNGVARVDFYDLCGQPLGPADYLALTEHVRVLILENIPTLGRGNFNEAKRFVTLIDTLYEAKTRLICSAADRPQMLYLEGEGSFEFERTASRLMEMQAADWGQL